MPHSCIHHHRQIENIEWKYENDSEQRRKNSQILKKLETCAQEQTTR